MARKKVKHLSTKNKSYIFQAACVKYITLKQNKAFKEKVYRFFSTKFDVAGFIKMRKTLKQHNTHVIALLMLYANKNSLLFKFLVVVFIASLKNMFLFVI